MAGEKYIALEETSQAIKTAVEGVKTDVAGVKTDVGGVKTDVGGVQTDVDTVGTDLTAVKNNIGTPAGGKTVVTMLDEIKNLSGGNEYLLLGSDTNVLLSKTINFVIRDDNEVVILNNKKTINLIPYANGEVTVRIKANNQSRYDANVNIYELSTNKKLGSIKYDSESAATKSVTINVNKNSNIIFKGETGYSNFSFTIKEIAILANVQKVDISKGLVFADLTNTVVVGK